MNILKYYSTLCIQIWYQSNFYSFLLNYCTSKTSKTTNRHSKIFWNTVYISHAVTSILKFFLGISFSPFLREYQPLNSFRLIKTVKDFIISKDTTSNCRITLRITAKKKMKKNERKKEKSRHGNRFIWELNNIKNYLTLLTGFNSRNLSAKDGMVEQEVGPSRKSNDPWTPR